MKSDLPARRFRRRREKGQKFLVNLSQSGVVFQQRFIDLSEALQNRRVRREFLTLLDECADNVDAHRNGAIATQYVCGLESTVFGEHPWAITDVSPGCGRNLRPHGLRTTGSDRRLRPDGFPA